MSIQLTFIDEVDYLLAELTGGAWETRDGVEAILSISERAKERGHKRILVDRRNLAKPVTEFARFEAGRTIAKEFPPPFRIAAVYRPFQCRFSPSRSARARRGVVSSRAVSAP